MPRVYNRSEIHAHFRLQNRSGNLKDALELLRLFENLFTKFVEPMTKLWHPRNMFPLSPNQRD